MSNVRSPGGASRSREQQLATDGKRYLQLSKLRDKAVRSVPQVAPKAKFFLSPTEHRHVTVALFVELTLSAIPREEAALEFYDAYRHLFDGGSIATLPVKSINTKALQARVKNTLRGGQLLDDTDEE